MATTLTAESSRTQLNSLRPNPAKARIDANHAETQGRIDAKAEFVSLIRRAMKAADLQQKVFALNAGVSESQIADGFNGVRNFAADWLWNQPPTFWVELVNEIATAKQLSAENVRAIRAARISELVRLLIEDVA